MKSYQFTVVIEPDEEAFHAFDPALPGCHTFGMTIDEAEGVSNEIAYVYLSWSIDLGIRLLRGQSGLTT